MSRRRNWLPRTPSPRRALPVALAMLFGAAGGALCFVAGLPLPWMIGSMMATMAAALGHVPVRMPLALRAVVVPVIGVMLGSTFTPELLSQVGAWSVSLGALLAYFIAATTLGYFYFARVAKYDPTTSYFCAVPGGLTEMTMIGGSYGGDEPTISLTHTARIVVVVILVPLAFRLLDGFPAGSAVGGAAVAAISAYDVALLTACAIAGYAIGTRFGLPAAAVIGPMLLSAAVHGAGLTVAQPPAALVAAAQVILGATIGCRFAGTSPTLIVRLVIFAAGSTVCTLVIALLFGWLLHVFTGLPLAALLLAYAPGGLTEMSLVALALGIDAAFVTTHHIVRVLLLIAFAPIAYRLLRPGANRGT